jgi:integrase/recombinase XerC
MPDAADDSRPLPPKARPRGDFTVCRDRAMLELFDALHLRPAQLAALDLDALTLPARLQVTDRSGRLTPWPLSETACRALQDWLLWRQSLGERAVTPALFVSRQGQRLSAAAVQQRIRRAGMARLPTPPDIDTDPLLQAADEPPRSALYAPLDFRHLARVYRKSHPRACRATQEARTRASPPDTQHADDDAP